MAVWQPLDREKLAAINRGDAAPYRALRACPSLNDALLDLADHAVRAFELGADETPDLLALSSHEQSNAPLDQRRIAATVAALLGVPAPNGGKPLLEERGLSAR